MVGGGWFWLVEGVLPEKLSVVVEGCGECQTESLPEVFRHLVDRPWWKRISRLSSLRVLLFWDWLGILDAMDV